MKNASLELGFNISAQNPCVDLSILRATPSAGPALDLLNKGAIVANESVLRIAPNGCRLPGRAAIPAGIRLAFDGAIFGTATHVDLKIERQLAAMNPVQHLNGAANHVITTQQLAAECRLQPLFVVV